MFNKRILPVVLAAGLGLAIGCRGGIAGHTSHGCLPGDLLAAKLQLTPGQQAAVHDVFKRHKPALAARMAAVVEARNAVMDSGMDPAVPPETWRVQQERMAGAVQAMAQEARGTYLDTLSLLSAAQKAEGKALLAKLHSRLARGHGRHHAFARRFIQGRLALTDAQSKAVQAVLDRHQAALDAKAATLRKAMASALETGLDPAASQAVLDQRFAAAREAAFAASAEARSVYLEVYPQLTSEQREAARGLVKDFREAVDGVRKLALGF